MGRPRAFDEGSVLDAAIDCFWQRGYEATSMRDLAHDMRMAGASLYNAFGDKRRLFSVALQRYLDRTARRQLASLDAATDPVAGLRRFFDNVVDGAAASGRGCLLVNSAIEIAPHDADLADEIRAGLDEIETGFRRAILLARQRGLIAKRGDPVDHSRLLLAMLIATLVLSRTGASRSKLESIVLPTLAMVIGPSRRTVRRPPIRRPRPAPLPK